MFRTQNEAILTRKHVFLYENASKTTPRDICSSVSHNLEINKQGIMHYSFDRYPPGAGGRFGVARLVRYTARNFDEKN